MKTIHVERSIFEGPNAFLFDMKDKEISENVDIKVVNVPSIKAVIPQNHDPEMIKVVTKEIHVDDMVTIYGYTKEMPIKFVKSKDIETLTFKKFIETDILFQDKRDEKVIVYVSEDGEIMNLSEAVTKYGDHDLFAFVGTNAVYSVDQPTRMFILY